MILGNFEALSQAQSYLILKQGQSKSLRLISLWSSSLHMAKAAAGVEKHNAAISSERQRVEWATAYDPPDEKGMSELRIDSWISFTTYRFKIGFPFIGGIVGIASRHKAILGAHPNFLMSWSAAEGTGVSGGLTLIVMDRQKEEPANIPDSDRFQIVSGKFQGMPS